MESAQEARVGIEIDGEWRIDLRDEEYPSPQIQISGKTLTVTGTWLRGSGGTAQGDLTVRCG